MRKSNPSHRRNLPAGLALAMTIEGAIDREVIPTRESIDGKLFLRVGERPQYQKDW